MLASGEYPGKGQLRRRAALVPRGLLDLSHEGQVLVERVAPEAGLVPPEVALGEVLRRLEAARQEAAPQRAKCRCLLEWAAKGPTAGEAATAEPDGQPGDGRLAGQSGVILEIRL